MRVSEAGCGDTPKLIYSPFLARPVLSPTEGMVEGANKRSLTSLFDTAYPRGYIRMDPVAILNNGYLRTPLFVMEAGIGR